MWGFARAVTYPTTQDETLRQVQVKTVRIFASGYAVVDNIPILSVQWFNYRAIGRLITPPALQAIARSLVTPCQYSHGLYGSGRLTFRFKSP